MLKHAVLTFSLCLALLAPARADSPLTSTDFWRAYKDVPQVATAHDIQRLNTRLGLYLDSSASIDHKAAVINALSWNVEGHENAMLFREILGQKYRVAPADVGPRLSPDESFCLAYLTALDDYMRPERYLGQMRKAHARLPHSFTVAMVASLMEAQNDFKTSKAWTDVAHVLDDRSLKMDMRRGARDIIVSYMKLYKSSK